MKRLALLALLLTGCAGHTYNAAAPLPPDVRFPASIHNSDVKFHLDVTPATDSVEILDGSFNYAFRNRISTSMGDLNPVNEDVATLTTQGEHTYIDGTLPDGIYRVEVGHHRKGNATKVYILLEQGQPVKLQSIEDSVGDYTVTLH